MVWSVRVQKTIQFKLFLSTQRSESSLGHYLLFIDQAFIRVLVRLVIAAAWYRLKGSCIKTYSGALNKREPIWINTLGNLRLGQGLSADENSLWLGGWR